MINKKNIIISGCSFSEYTTGEPYFTWSNYLLDEFKHKLKIYNEAKDSQGQGIIVQKVIDRIIDLKFDVDLIIIQWSAITRGFAKNEIDFIKRIIDNKSYIDFLPFSLEYYGGGDLDYVSDSNEIIHDIYYKYSLVQMILLINFLENYNLKYKMFWGWQQISNEVEDKFKNYFDIIYNNNFWLHNRNGGMKEYCEMKIGNLAILKNDLHPSSQAQKYFYETVIKNFINEINFLK